MGDLTKGERRHLSRYVCGWCDQRGDRDTCGAIYEKCSDAARNQRRAECLAEYKPRLIPASKDSSNE
jgi:hypothetical protein